MKILHIVAGLSPAGGGLSEVVPRFAMEASGLGHDVTLATIASGDEPLSHAATEAALSGVSIVRFAPSAPRALFSRWDMLRGLPALAHAADIAHVHSNWTFPVWWGCRSRPRRGQAAGDVAAGLLGSGSARGIPPGRNAWPACSIAATCGRPRRSMRRATWNATGSNATPAKGRGSA